MENITGKEFDSKYDYLWGPPSKTINDITVPVDADGNRPQIPNPLFDAGYAKHMAEQEWAKAWNDHFANGKDVHIQFISGIYAGSIYKMVPNYYTVRSWGDNPYLYRLEAPVSVLTGKKRGRRVKNIDEIKFLFDYTGETVEIKTDPIVTNNIADDNGVAIKVGDYVLGTYRKYIPNTQGQFKSIMGFIKYVKSTEKTIFFETESGDTVKGERASFSLMAVDIDPLIISAKALGAANMFSKGKLSLTLNTD